MSTIEAKEGQEFLKFIFEEADQLIVTEHEM